MTKELNIGGLTPLTTIDFPGELSAVVFCQGCPWRCRYCQNGHLLPGKAQTQIRWSEVLEFLQTRQGLLDAVVFSGGEPTQQRGLAEATNQVKALGFKVGLHSAGCYPDRLAKLLPLVDWVGLDIKGLVDDYSAITGVAGSGERAWESLRLLSSSSIAYEIRTTVHPDLTDTPRMNRLVEQLEALNIRRYSIQRCQIQHCLDAELGVAGPDPMNDLPIERYSAAFPGFQIRP